MVGGDRVCQALQEHGLAGAGRGHNQAALPLADRREQVHNTCADVLANGLELDTLLRIQRREVVEEDLVARLFRRLEVDCLDFDQREILLALMWRAYLPADGIACLQVELADLRRRNVNVVRTRKVVVIGRAQKAIAVRQDFQYSLREDMAFLFALGLKDLKNEVLLAQ